MLKIYDSFSKQKKILNTLEPNKVTLYVCGVTVYDYCHIGHARTYLSFDLLVRFLRWRGFEVTYVRNITDIDDKIIKRAQENKESTQDLVKRHIAIMHQDFNALHILPPDAEPKATETIDDMLAMIQKLIDQGYAYAANNGDVYYRVSQFKPYGKLSGQSIEHLQSGERIDINPNKEDPLDFVLWKTAKPGEPSWDSPWGKGRPGWHIECSAMTKRCLGETFDIHAGGSDLRFPHHENEIAQSEAANGCQFARYWMHSGMVQVNDEKMSKSLGNFFVIRDVLKQYPAEVIRYFLTSGHYRSDINYTTDNLDLAKAALSRFYTALRGLTISDQLPEKESFTSRFITAMEDDLNIPEALAVLFDLTRYINSLKQNHIDQASQFAALLKQLAAVLGLLQQDAETFFQGAQNDVVTIEALIEKRNHARATKDWATADSARDELTAMGIAIEDSAKGTSWRKL